VGSASREEGLPGHYYKLYNQENGMKKIVIVAVILLFSIGCAGVAWSAVEGEWGVSGKMSMKLKIKGAGKSKDRDYVVDSFSFSPNGDFEMSDMAGSWEETKKGYSVDLDLTPMEELYEEIMSDELGVDVYVTDTEAIFIGKEKKNNTIKGKFKFVMTFYITVYDLVGTVKMKWKYKGIRSAAALQVSPEDTSISFEFEDALLEVIQGAFDEATLTEYQ